ncbi:MAG: biopolymer transporter ExbD [Bacteroidetes bacterium]|nr:MAG: biopolymer transporter ExbD [Bacteroidota bacterium]
MAEVQQQDSGSGKGKHSKVRAKKASTHIDMTPMVDLAFLLLTFFILTTTLSKPRTMDITMPVKDDIKEEDRSKVPASQTLSILLTENDKIIWYMGVDNPETPPETNVADFSASGPNSVHKMLLEKNKIVLDLVKMVEDSVRAGLIPNKPEEIKQHKAAVKAAEKKGLIVLIKPDEKAKYRNLVDILDEMLVTNVARYAIVDLSESEKELILNAK